MNLRQHARTLATVAMLALAILSRQTFSRLGRH